MKKLTALLVFLAALMCGHVAHAGPGPSWNGLSYSSSGTTFATLTTNPPQVSGTLAYCSDCTQTTTCAGGGSGAWAQFVNGLWGCNLNGVSQAAPSATVNTLTATNASITNLTTQSSNNVLNAAQFPGADIGAKINTAIAALPTITEASTAFNGQISGTTLTVNSINAGNGGVDVGLVIAGTGVTAGTTITARGTGTGGTGTYTVNNSQSVAAEAMTSTYAYPVGTVFVPSTGAVQTTTTTIGRTAGSSAPAMTFVNLVCDKGAQIQNTLTAASTIWIDAQDPFGMDGNVPAGATGGVYNCSFQGPTGMGANDVGILTGNIGRGYHIVNNNWNNFNGNADAAVELQNTVYFTEGTWMAQDDMFQASIGLLFNENCATGTVTCLNSFEHGHYQYYWGGNFGANNNYALKATCTSGANGAACGTFPNGTGPRAQFSTWDLQFNINGTGTANAVVSMDAASEFFQNTGVFYGENDSAHGFMFDPNGTGYYELNRLAGVCTGCNDTNTQNTNNGYDSILETGSAPYGSFAANAFPAFIQNTQQQFQLLQMACQNVNGGTCTTAPTFILTNLTSGGATWATLVCPNTVGQTNTSTFTTGNGGGNLVQPTQNLFINMSSAGTSCTAPYFNVMVHYKTY